jgi:hypothetical protein
LRRRPLGESVACQRTCACRCDSNFGVWFRQPAPSRGPRDAVDAMLAIVARPFMSAIGAPTVCFARPFGCKGSRRSRSAFNASDGLNTGRHGTRNRRRSPYACLVSLFREPPASVFQTGPIAWGVFACSPDGKCSCCEWRLNVPWLARCRPGAFSLNARQPERRKLQGFNLKTREEAPVPREPAGVFSLDFEDRRGR